MFNQLIKDLNLDSNQYYKNYELLDEKLIIKAVTSVSDVFLLREIARIYEEIDKDIFNFFHENNMIVITCKAVNQ